MVQYTLSFLQEICFHSLCEDRGTITYSRTILYDTDIICGMFCVTPLLVISFSFLRFIEE